MPEVLHKKWGYPEITEADKRNILGLNSARLYHVGETRSNKYSKVPKNFERQIPDDLKALLEFPGSRVEAMAMSARPLPPTIFPR